MNIEGNVTSKEGFLSLLRALSESKSSGALIVTDRDVERRLFFENGAIVAAASSARRESFGHFLVQRAIIHERTLSNVEEHQNEDEDATLFGQTLVDLGVMSELEVENALRLHIKKAILDIYSGRGRFTLVDERLGEQRKVRVAVDARELLAKDIEAELGDSQTPTVVAEKPVPRPPIREVDTPSYTPPRPPIDVGEVRRSSPASGGGDTQSELSDAIARSVQWTSDSHRDPLRYLLLVVGCIIAGLALSVLSLWLMQESTDREGGDERLPVGSADMNVEGSAPSEPSDPPLETDAAPPPEQRPEIPLTEPASGFTEEIVPPPTLQPVRPKVETSAEKAPPRPVSQAKPVGRQAEAVQESVAELSSTAGSRANEMPPKVDATPVAADVVKIDPPASLPVPEANPERSEGRETAVVEAPPSKPVVQPGDLVEPAFDVIEPVLLEMPKLHYPKDAKRRKLEAVVRVRILVDENGRVLKAEVQDFVGHGFDEAALSVAVRTQFIPATKGTVPVKMWTTFPIVYRLEKK